MNSATLYTPDFFTSQRPDSELTAQVILGLLFPMLSKTQSVCDVGCGTGCWLKVARELGVEQVIGFDGRWAGNSLVIPETCFCETDLNEFLQEPPMWAGHKTPKKDLVLCLETAEHLEPESAEPLVQWLTELSDVVLFSAAIPGQGGTGHINEQWTGYWVRLFEERGYLCYDAIRPEIWEDQRIPFWYRQNTLVFENKKGDNEAADFGETPPGAMTIVHPELYQRRSGFFR